MTYPRDVSVYLYYADLSLFRTVKVRVHSEREDDLVCLMQYAYCLEIMVKSASGSNFIFGQKAHKLFDYLFNNHEVVGWDGRSQPTDPPRP